MAADRIEILKAMLERNPADSFLQYGLAMEYANSGHLEEAVREYQAIVEKNENYAAAYYHGGQALERLGRIDEARAMYEKGIDVTGRLGDAKTRNELQAALDMLPL